MAEKNITGMTALLGKFQVTLWHEYAARKQRPAEKPVSPHVESPEPDGRQREQIIKKDTNKPSISDAFAREEGRDAPIFDEWCDEIYNNASPSPNQHGTASLNAHDTGVIQCALLRFLGKRQVVGPGSAVSEQLLRDFPRSHGNFRKLWMRLGGCTILPATAYLSPRL